MSKITHLQLVSPAAAKKSEEVKSKINEQVKRLEGNKRSTNLRGRMMEEGRGREKERGRERGGRELELIWNDGIMEYSNGMMGSLLSPA